MIEVCKNRVRIKHIGGYKKMSFKTNKEQRLNQLFQTVSFKATSGDDIDGA